MNVAERQDQLIADYGIIEDPQERLAAITSDGHTVPAPPDDYCQEVNRVSGCTTQVWVKSELRDGRLYLRSAASSPLVAGLVALLCRIYDGGTPAEIIATEPEVLTALRLDRMLSPTRQRGITAVRAHLVALAQAAI